MRNPKAWSPASSCAGRVRRGAPGPRLGTSRSSDARHPRWRTPHASRSVSQRYAAPTPAVPSPCDQGDNASQGAVEVAQWQSEDRCCCRRRDQPWRRWCDGEPAHIYAESAGSPVREREREFTRSAHQRCGDDEGSDSGAGEDRASHHGVGQRPGHDNRPCDHGGGCPDDQGRHRRQDDRGCSEDDYCDEDHNETCRTGHRHPRRVLLRGGATGVTSTGKAMVCKVSATDTRLRWRAA